MRRLVASLFMLLLVGVPFLMAQGGGEAAGEAGEVLITLWTQEGEAEGAFQFVQTLAQEFSEAHEGVTIEVLNKDTEALREDFQTASLAGAAPDLLWTVNDHAGPFVVADLIQPVENLVDLSKYVPSVEMKGHVWGVPISSGNHLMLLYNKDLVPNPPKTTDELIKIGSQLKAKGVIPLVFNQTEPFWLVPWLGGFGGKVFASDGVTPTLDTKEMVATLKFLHELKFTHGLLPPESDYDGADTLFKEGKAAMIINGDWSLSGYREAMGDKLGVARIPKVSATGLWPAPYTSGKYFMIPKEVSGAKLSAVVEFIKYATNYDNQIRMVKTLSRLPGLKAALDDPLIKNDPILKASADQMAVGTPMPSVVEMRAVWDAMKPEMNAVLADQKTPEEAAAAMQGAAEAGIEALR
ncbi:extracellular solute-binding protein [Spirochaeta thermophila]|uniref:Putative maltosaccharide-binding protein n=1 Tax=Winmispira thermophila (strain ATCC 49972 / DSM 6192 / RI 19.B1) TaxID=665571 RepID=E0RSH5_WINT6|nr:extracellular solute-binding protein [Spirochaeta thermophila]ADN01962.1 putative maltosaccharide-binding protein [Spirochaeta thermophila DSM 6192]